MKNIYRIFIALFTMGALVSCDFDDDFTPPNYVSMERGPKAVGVDLGGSKAQEITVYTGNETGADRTFNILVAPASTLSAAAYTVPATVTVPANTNSGTFTVNLTDTDISAAGETLILNLQPEAGLTAGAPLTLNISQVCPYTETLVSFQFDGWASETTWEISDSEGEVLFSGGDYSDGQASANRTLCIAPGVYKFTVFDGYGDGMSDPADGSVTLTYGTTELGTISGDFGVEASFDFTLQ